MQSMNHSQWSGLVTFPKSFRDTLNRGFDNIQISGENLQNFQSQSHPIPIKNSKYESQSHPSSIPSSIPSPMALSSQTK